MTDARPSIAEIKARAEAMILDLARELAPDRGSVEGIHYRACNPTRADASPGSFVIDVGGAAPGRWMEFAAGQSAKSGEGGDVVDLVAYVHSQGVNFKSRAARGAAIQWLGERVGLLTAGDRKTRTAARRKTSDEIAAAQREAEFRAQLEAKIADRRAGQAKTWWLKSGEACPDSATERYLVGERGLPTHRLAKWPGAIRNLPERLDQHGEIHGAAMFCAMTATLDAGALKGQGAIRAVHRTFLTNEGRKDPDAETPRKMWGDPRGAAIRISKGGSWRSPEDAVEASEFKTLVITEGVEDAIVAALLWPDRRVWAAGTVGNIGAIARRYGWPLCASDILICADNDPEGSSADKTLDAGVQAWMDVCLGRPVAVARAVGAHDLNDLWRAA